MSAQKLSQMKLSLLRVMQKRQKRKDYLRRIKRLHIKHNIQPSIPQDWHLIRGDTVEILRGRDQGKQGKIIKVHRKGEACIVKGCNLRLHKTQSSTGGMITEWKEQRILKQNLALVDQETGLPTPIEYKYSQTRIDTGRFERVRQSTLSADIFSKPPESKPKRTIHEPHKTKDTPLKLANIRTWIGPWEMFTDTQKEWILNDAKYVKKLDYADIENKIHELIYNNVEEVEDYIRLLPYCPHSFFQPGNCEPYYYDPHRGRMHRWSKRRLHREIRMGEGATVVSDEVKDQLQGMTKFPIYLSKPIDANHYWPRVRPEIDPKMKKLEYYLKNKEKNVKELEVNDEEYDEYDEESEGEQEM